MKSTNPKQLSVLNHCIHLSTPPQEDLNRFQNVYYCVLNHQCKAWLGRQTLVLIKNSHDFHQLSDNLLLFMKTCAKKIFVDNKSPPNIAQQLFSVQPGGTTINFLSLGKINCFFSLRIEAAAFTVSQFELDCHAEKMCTAKTCCRQPLFPPLFPLVT